MTIELLADNCKKCQLMKRNIEQALHNFHPNVKLHIREEPKAFVDYGLFALPGFAINGRVKSEGKLLSPPKILSLLKASH